MSDHLEPTSRYRLLAKWASGGMADVYVARQQGAGGFDKIVALKFMRDAGDDPSLRDMFLEEVRTAALLNHPSIIQTFDAGQIGDRLYMAMEFVNGEQLGRFARVVRETNGTFPTELAIAITRDLANALDYAHTQTNLDGVPLQLVHRDVSPSNILLSFDGMVKLLDFGIAKVATKLQDTKTGVIKGKFSYMSPEQARGEAIDQRSDIYSLGIVMWQLLTGKQAFENVSEAELLQAVCEPKIVPPSQAGAKTNEALDAIVMEALAPKASERYATAGELATALSRYLTRTAAGFDSTKIIRALMAARFNERKDRLAQLVKGHGKDVPLDEIEQMMQQPTMKTPLPRAASTTAARPVDPGSALNQVPTLTQPAAVAPTPGRRSGGWIAFALLAAAIAVGAFVAHDRGLLGNGTSARPTVASTPQPAVTAPPTAATATRDNSPAAIAPAPAPTPPADPIPAVQTAAPVADPPTMNEPVRTVAKPERKTKSAKVAMSATRPPSTGTTKPTPMATPSGTGSDVAPRATMSTGSAATASELPKPAAPAATGGSGTAGTPPVATKPVTPAPVVTPKPAAPAAIAAAPKPTGSLDAVPSIGKVAVDGSLPTSEIQNALDRTGSALRDCYRVAAKKLNQTPALTLKLSFQVDEGRALSNVKVTGDSLGLGACVKDAVSGIRTRSAPDVGTVSVVAQINFKPVTK